VAPDSFAKPIKTANFLNVILQTKPVLLLEEQASIA